LGMAHNLISTIIADFLNYVYQTKILRNFNFQYQNISNYVQNSLVYFNPVILAMEL